MKKHKNNVFFEEETEADALSEEELSMLKASVESAKIDRSKLPPHDRSEKAKFFRLIKGNILLTVCAIFVCVALLAGVVFGAVFGISRLIENNRKYTFIIGDLEEYEVAAKSAVIDDILYVDMRKIAAHTNMMISGTESRIQFTTKNGTYMIFEDNYGYATINGQRTEIRANTLDGRREISAVAYVSKDECLIPFSFLEMTADESTLRLEFDPEARTVGIYPKYIIYNHDMDTKTMRAVRFNVLKWSEPPVYTYEYEINVSEYLESIKSEYLLLVNKSNFLGEDYEPEDLTNVMGATDGESQRLRYDAERALYAMMLDMEQAGVEDVYVTSSYRSYAYQYRLYWEIYVDKYIGQGYSPEEAMAKASTYSARPGESEHQTGLCLDFTTDSLNGSLTEKFENTEAFKWLSENAYKYGFILRYPKEAEKEAITGYDYEPWHYRFVGRQAATEMYYSGECLEEYLTPDE